MLVLLLAACGDAAPGLPVTAPERCAPLRGASLTTPREPTRVLALGSNYQSGSAWAIDPISLRPNALALGVAGDSIARVAGQVLGVLHRAAGTGDNLTLFDLRGAAPVYVTQVSLTTASERARGLRAVNAHDLVAVDETRIYVSRYALDALAVFDVTACAVTATVDLGPYRGSARRPDMSALVRVGDEVWVALQRLDDSANPRQPGLIVRIAPRTREVTGTVELPRANPLTGFRWLVPGRTLLIATVGAYGVVGDGAVERIDFGEGRAVVGEPLVREDEVNGNIDDVAVIDEDTLVLKVAARREGTANIGSTRILRWHIPSRSFQELLRSPSWNPAPVHVQQGRVYVGDSGDAETGAGAGVQVFDTRGTRLNTAAIPVGPGLWPYDFRAIP